jgi:hypothetical protein
MTSLASLIGSFAAPLVPHPDNAALLRQWTAGARAADLPHLHAYGLDLDLQAATAALPYHNGRTEGVNNTIKTKMIKGRCTAAPASPSSATGSCSADTTLRHHRKCDRAISTV